MDDSFLKLQEMCSLSQKVFIEVYGILNTGFSPNVLTTSISSCAQIQILIQCNKPKAHEHINSHTITINMYIYEGVSES